MPRHVVVDGSNLATEGRSLPSLKQLNEAVLAFMEEHPNDLITVVVDATFGHRIDPREVAEFDAAIENNELVAPPAGAIGRGDAFVLTIANKVNATVLSNDSYQEFHGDYEWLFDEGRLIGGKPVPNVGWVFVPRIPVRGPVSRRAVKDAKKISKATTRASSRSSGPAGRPSKEASQPMPVPSAPPPGTKGRSGGSRSAAATAGAPADATGAAKGAAATSSPKPAEQAEAPTGARPHMVNDLLPFLTFVEQHPIGSPVAATVESYSSHGAYVTLGDARGYVPLRLMADPPPRSAREMMKLGTTVDLVVVSFNANRRSIDLCVAGMEPAEVRALAGAPEPVKRSRRKAAAAPPVEAQVPAEIAAPAPARRARQKKAAAPEVEVAPETPVAPVARPEAERAATPPAAPAPAKRTRKKAASPEPTAEPAPAAAAPPKRTAKATKGTKAAKAGPAAKATPAAEPTTAAEPAPTAKRPARPRTKAAAAAIAMSPATDGSEPTGTASAAAQPAPAKRSRKKAATA